MRNMDHIKLSPFWGTGICRQSHAPPRDLPPCVVFCEGHATRAMEHNITMGWADASQIGLGHVPFGPPTGCPLLTGDLHPPSQLKTPLANYPTQLPTKKVARASDFVRLSLEAGLRSDQKQRSRLKREMRSQCDWIKF